MAEYLRSSAPAYQQVDSGGVLNIVNRVMKLTRGKLLKQPDWSEWQDSEYLQLNQYYDQGMFVGIAVDTLSTLGHSFSYHPSSS